MIRVSRWRQRSGVISLVSLVVAIAAWVVFAGEAKQPQLGAASPAALRKPTGYPQLISVEPLPVMDGEMCQWVPASANTTLVASLWQGQSTGSPTAQSSGQTRIPIDANRAPLRVIRDPNPAFSAVAVEPESGMLVVTDENLFQILEYNREDNTPPTATMTEPKRVIGGNLTKAEMMCGVYIDPKTLDIYVINNDTQDWMAVFSKEARGNVAPDRFLAIPHGTFDITVDEKQQEIFLTVEHSNAVVVYRKMAEGQEPPLRRLFGDDTELEDPHGIAVDTKNHLLFVSNHGNVRYRNKGGEQDIRGTSNQDPRRMRRFLRGSGKFEPPSITVYVRDASGNTAPLRIIEGPKTGLNWPMHLAVDEERGELYVANDMDHSILVFRTSDEGDVVPSRIIQGPRTGIRNPTSVTWDLKNGEVWVANMGNHSATAYPLTANGNVAPLRTIRGGPADEVALMIGNPGGVGYDTKREEILVPN